MTHSNQNVFRTVAILVIFIWSVSKVAAGIHLTGTFDCTTFAPNGKLWMSMCSSNDFDAAFDDSRRWRLQITTRDTNTDIFILTFDGTNLFYEQYVQKTLGPIVKGRPQVIDAPIAAKTNFAAVSEGKYPWVCPDDQKRTVALWLCLASGGYLHEMKTNDFPLPWEDPRKDLVAYGYRFEANFVDNALDIPNRITFIRSTDLDLPFEEELNRSHLRAARDESGIVQYKRQLTDRKKLIPNGFVMGLMEAVITNQNGFKIPSSFVFEDFLPNRVGEQRLSAKYTGKVLTVSIYGEQINHSAPPAELSVMDLRFHYRDASRDVGYILYPVHKDDSWPDQNSPTLKQIYQTALADPAASYRIRPFRQQLVRITILLGALTLGLVLPVILYKRGRKKLVGRA